MWVRWIQWTVKYEQVQKQHVFSRLLCVCCVHRSQQGLHVIGLVAGDVGRHRWTQKSQVWISSQVDEDAVTHGEDRINKAHKHKHTTTGVYVLACHSSARSFQLKNTFTFSLFIFFYNCLNIHIFIRVLIAAYFNPQGSWVIGLCRCRIPSGISAGFKFTPQRLQACQRLEKEFVVSWR